MPRSFLVKDNSPEWFSHNASHYWCVFEVTQTVLDSLNHHYIMRKTFVMLHSMMIRRLAQFVASFGQGLYAKQTFPVARGKRLTIVMQGTFVASHVTVITITELQDILVSQSNSTYDLIGCCWSGGGSISSCVRDWGQRCTDVRGGQSRRIQWLANSTPNICWVTRSSLLKYARYVSRYRQ